MVGRVLSSIPRRRVRRDLFVSNFIFDRIVIVSNTSTTLVEESSRSGQQDRREEMLPELRQLVQKNRHIEEAHEFRMRSRATIRVRDLS